MNLIKSLIFLTTLVMTPWLTYSQDTEESLQDSNDILKTETGYDISDSYIKNIAYWLQYGDTLTLELVDSWLKNEKLQREKDQLKTEVKILNNLSLAQDLRLDSLETTNEFNFKAASKNKNIAKINESKAIDHLLASEKYRRKRNGWRVTGVLGILATGVLTYIIIKDD